MFELKGETESYKLFLEEWNNEKDYIVAHTSGSTGVPKLIQLSKADMLSSAESTVSFFELNDESVLFSPLSAEYIAGKMMLVRAIVADCKLFIEKPSSTPLSNISSTSFERIDLLPVVPAQISGIMDNPGLAPILTNVIVGGAPLTSTQENSLLKMPWQTCVTYGMTETCSHIALRPVGQELYRALPGFTFSTDNRQCLVIESDSMSFGRLVTNDVVRLSSPDSFEWLGRYDNVINTGAMKVHPEMVEKLLAPDIGVPFYIKGEADDKWGSCVTLILEDPENLISDVSLKKTFDRLLKPHEKPKIIKRLAKLNRTDSGKIKR